jgi:hypothetical protein
MHGGDIEANHLTGVLAGADILEHQLEYQVDGDRGRRGGWRLGRRMVNRRL